MIMPRPLLTVAIALGALQTPQQAPATAPAGALALFSATRIAAVSPPASILGLFGRAADPAEYAGSVFINESGCTAVLIGPQVLISAAHCFTKPKRDDGTVRPARLWFQLRDGRAYEAACEQYSRYEAERHVGDLALCKVTSGSVDGVLYETVSYDPRLVDVGKGLLATGWEETATDVADKRFTTGLAMVVSAPPTVEDSDAVVAVSAGLAAAAAGGAAFAVLDVSQNHRVLVAINSRRDPVADVTQSTLSSLSRSGKAFIASWASTHGAPLICSAGAPDPRCHR